MKKKIAIFIVSGMLFLLTIIFGIIAALIPKKNKKTATRNVIPEQVAYTQHYKQKHQDKPIYIPIKEDKNGVYVANVLVDGQNVAAVVDTGSAHMLVAGNNCNTCMFTKTNGTILPASTPKQFNDKLSFGSQKDTINWHDGTVSIGKHTFDSEYALVRERRGSSSYNVLGLGRVNSSRRTLFSYMNLFHKILTFNLCTTNSYLLIGGKRNQHPRSQFWIPMLPPPFYRAKLWELRCGTFKANDILLPVKGVIFDTGSNMMDLPPGLYNAVKSKLDTNQEISLTFGSNNLFGGGNFLQIQYAPTQYRWRGNKLLIVEGTDTEHIVLGSLFMKYLQISIDIDKNKIGITKLF